MLLIFSLFAAVLPALLLVRYFVKKDYFPEPTHLIVKTFLWGLAIAIPILLVEIPLMYGVESIEVPLVRPFLIAFLVAGLIEEFFKLLVLHSYCARKPEFDEPMDGVVYGAVASLGFACIENVIYVAEGGLMFAIGRALTAVPAHASLGALMGYYYSRERFGPEGKVRLLGRTLWIPVFLHGLYNFFPMVLMYDSEWLPMLATIACLVMFFVVLVFLVTRAVMVTDGLRWWQLRRNRMDIADRDVG